MKKEKLCLSSFLQALGLTAYISLVSIIFWKGNVWFPKMNLYLGPLLMLSLFAASALICALITLGYPFILFWDKKKPKEALKIVIYTALWIAGFIAAMFILLAIIK